uniref:Clathrin light chain n=1 Tax=Nothobranchius furzeri TaxID=105023 RepID=A0A8C6LR81_NOTFU
MANNGVNLVEEDPAAAFLAQQENEIAGIENDSEDLQPPVSLANIKNISAQTGKAAFLSVNWFLKQESNGPTDGYAAIAQVDIQRQEPESLRKWREEQRSRLEALDSASKAAEEEWREKAKKELEDWHVHQSEQMEKNKANNRSSEEAFLAESDGPGAEWERVARLCDFNPKTSKQAKDVSRMRSILISLKQTPLIR